MLPTQNCPFFSLVFCLFVARKHWKLALTHIWLAHSWLNIGKQIELLDRLWLFGSSTPFMLLDIIPAFQGNGKNFPPRKFYIISQLWTELTIYQMQKWFSSFVIWEIDAECSFKSICHWTQVWAARKTGKKDQMQRFKENVVISKFTTGFDSQWPSFKTWAASWFWIHGAFKSVYFNSFWIGETIDCRFNTRN